MHSIYNQIAVCFNSVCPVCKQTLASTNNAKVMLYKVKYSPQSTELSLPFCPKCGMHFVTPKICMSVRTRFHGYQVSSVFADGLSLQELNKLVDEALPLTAFSHSAHTANHYFKRVMDVFSHPYDIIEVKSIGRYMHNLTLKSCENLTYTVKCGSCQEMLTIETKLIPVTFYQCARVPGKYCPHCNVLYVEGSDNAKKILRDNLLARDITLDGRTFEDYTSRQEAARAEKMQHEREEREKAERESAEAQKAERINRIKAIPSATILIETEEDSRDETYFIVENKSDEGRHSLHYSAPFACELLAALYEPSKDKIALWQGRKIIIKGSEVLSEMDSELGRYILTEQRRMVDVSIKKGGGLYSAQRIGTEKLVDILLFSPYTQRYELAHATYDIETGSCCMDISLFRGFVRKYGTPGIDRILFAKTGRSSRYNWDDLQVQSILKEYGYSVSQKDQLTERTRHDLLCEIVDLEILSVGQVLGYLDFFIASHTDDKYASARDKWERDKNFISGYKVNPGRFLIAKNRHIH